MLVRMRGLNENAIKSLRWVGIGLLLAGALIPAMLLGYANAVEGAGSSPMGAPPIGENHKGRVEVNGTPAPWVGSARPRTPPAPKTAERAPAAPAGAVSAPE